MRPYRLALLAAVAFASPATGQRPASDRPASNDAINIPVERYRLPNGLTVILAPNRATPMVTVDVWYHVGSKNERAGRTGFAHLFEHVMFTGSANAPYPLHDNLTEGVSGVASNGSTSEDRTNYYETVPSNYLESTLWLEADRMGFLLETLDSAKFSAQRDIVQNERRQSVDNQPYGRASEILNVAMYPDTNPYHWPVVGYMTDLQNSGIEDVKSFFRLYYAPSNATVAIVGDFDAARAKAWVARYFGDLPRGSTITRPAAAPPRMTAEVRLTYEDRVQIPRLYISWPTTGIKHDDRYALNVLSEILTGSRTARLTKALVYDHQSAANVFASASGYESLGDFTIAVVPRPGHTLTQLEAATDSVITRFKHEGPTAEELARALAGIEFSFVSGLQSNFGKAETLLRGSVFHGDPLHYRTQYSRMRSVTAVDVKRVANTYLGHGRVVLSVVPEGKTELAARAQSSRKVTVAPDGAHYILGDK
jgi:zinc protease